MSKRKLRILIFLGFLALYIICFAFTFFAIKNNKQSDYDFFEYKIATSIQDKYDGTPEDAIMQMYYSETSKSKNNIPFYIYAFPVQEDETEPNSQVITVKSYIAIEDYQTDYYEKIYLDEYLTYDMKKQVVDFVVDFVSDDSFDSLEISKLDYCEKDGKIIPVDLYLENKYDWEGENSNTLKLHLTDNEIQNSLERIYFDEVGKHLSIFIYDYTFDEDGHYYKFFENSDNCVYATFTEFTSLDNTNYEVNMIASYDATYETLKSDEFRYMCLYEFLILDFILIITTLICEKIYDKNKRLNDSRMAFICAAAHELKTPISAIENCSECIIEDIAPEKNEKYIKTIHSESLRMNKLVATLLQYNRLASSIKVEKKYCMLNEILESEISQYQVLAEGKSIIIESNICQEAKIYANEDLISLVIDNFLSNAIKHTAQSKKIKVALEKRSHHFRVSVYNDGEWIRTENKDSLWEIFYRADKARNSNDNSTGMGLAICKQILKLHKYKYGFTNKLNGVEFYFET